ncbi:hypothetical protein [Oceanobacillus sp. AG]|uniref:hypothetical protein n=1 Tax=Oceanobacillus sp. AG TaxID=2681969 RepID=UPI0012EC22AF|nr:hypothetical protein [Oceanobacillus sp. AG]
MSNTYTTGQVAKILGEDHRNQVNRIMKYMGMNLEKNERGHYIIDDESLDLIRMYADFKKNVKITYKDFNELENIIEMSHLKLKLFKGHLIFWLIMIIQRVIFLQKNYFI